MSRVHARSLTGMAAPLAVWALHFIVVYAIQAIACRQGWHALRWAGRDAIVWCLLLLTLAAMLTTAWLGWRAWRQRPASTRSGTGHDAPPLDRFMATLTTAVSVLATVAIAFIGIPLLILSTCR